MHTIEKKAISIVIATMMTSSLAFAQQYHNNEQSSRTETRAELNAGLENIQGKVNLTAAAIGNSFTVETTDMSTLSSSQNVGSYSENIQTSAELNINPEDQLQNVQGTAAAIGNSASLTLQNTTTQPWFTNNQSVYGDTSAIVDADLEGVAGDVELTAAAIGNSLTIETELATGMYNNQFVDGNTYANLYMNTNEMIDGDLTATAAAIGNSASNTWAVVGDHNSLENTQAVRGDVEAEVELSTHEYTNGALNSTSAAIGNSFTAEGVGEFSSFNAQYIEGDVIATSDIQLEGLSKEVNITTAAIGNSASYTLENGYTTWLPSEQITYGEVIARADIDLLDVNADIEITTAAMGNSFSGSTLGDVSGLSATQYNRADVSAVTNVALTDVMGDVSLTSAAIGNSVNISNVLGK